jgi:hypothetical protein
MANCFESWKQKRTASKKTAQEEIKEDNLETVEVPGEVQEVSVDEVPAEAPVAEEIEETVETPEEGVSQISLKVTNADDLELAKEAIKDALEDANVDFSFDATSTVYEEEEAEEVAEEEKEEGDEVEETEEEEEIIESPMQEVEAKCDGFRKYSEEREAARKVNLGKRLETMRMGTDYNEVMSRSSLAPKKKVAHRVASSLKQGGKYVVDNSVIEILGIDSNNDLVEYYDGKKDRTISASLTEVEKKVTDAENARVAKEKEKAIK